MAAGRLLRSLHSLSARIAQTTSTTIAKVYKLGEEAFELFTGCSGSWSCRGSVGSVGSVVSNKGSPICTGGGGLDCTGVALQVVSIAKSLFHWLFESLFNTLCKELSNNLLRMQKSLVTTFTCNTSSIGRVTLGITHAHMLNTFSSAPFFAIYAYCVAVEIIKPILADTW